jgi:hypothetical protein
MGIFQRPRLARILERTRPDNQWADGEPLSLPLGLLAGLDQRPTLAISAQLKPFPQSNLRKAPRVAEVS